MITSGTAPPGYEGRGTFTRLVCGWALNRIARNSERGENLIGPWNIAGRCRSLQCGAYIAAGWISRCFKRNTGGKNEENFCLCNAMRNCNDTRLESAAERSVGVCFRSISLLPARFLKRRGHELLFQFEESMRISRIMHSQSPIFGRGWRTRMEAQK